MFFVFFIFKGDIYWRCKTFISVPCLPEPECPEGGVEELP